MTVCKSLSTISQRAAGASITRRHRLPIPYGTELQDRVIYVGLPMQSIAILTGEG